MFNRQDHSRQLQMDADDAHEKALRLKVARFRNAGLRPRLIKSAETELANFLKKRERDE